MTERCVVLPPGWLGARVMAITPFLAGQAFDPEAIEKMSAAFVATLRRTASENR
jgi:hypothetical protein